MLNNCIEICINEREKLTMRSDCDGGFMVAESEYTVVPKMSIVRNSIVANNFDNT